MTAGITYYNFFYFSAALVLSYCLVPFMRPVAFRVGAVDKGEGRRIHDGTVPRLGGVGIFLALIAPMAFYLMRGAWGEFHYKMSGVLVASTLVFLIGLYDDMKGARIKNKLLAEILAALLLYAWGIRIEHISNPFGGAIDLGWLSLPATLLWVIVITNAINLIDGLDGLAAGTSIMIASTLFIFGSSDPHLQITLAMLVGSLLGFLRYNFPPASIFMGDSGSLFLGFFLAAISIVSSYKAAAMATMMIPLVAFSMPLMDMFYAVIRRHYRGLPLGEADREHIHHKLLEKGLSKRNVLFVLYFANISIMLSAFVIVKRQANLDWLVLVTIFILALVGMRLLGYVEFRPLVKEIIKGHRLNEKRRYFNYIIKRFRHDAVNAENADDIKLHLTNLVREYDFRAVEIQLDLPYVENPVFHYNGYNGSPCPPGEQVSLNFPIAHKEKVIGTVSLKRDINCASILYTSDMLDTLSEGVMRLIEIQYGNKVQTAYAREPGSGLGQ